MRAVPAADAYQSSHSLHEIAGQSARVCSNYQGTSVQSIVGFHIPHSFNLHRCLYCKLPYCKQAVMLPLMSFQWSSETYVSGVRAWGGLLTQMQSLGLSCTTCLCLELACCSAETTASTQVCPVKPLILQSRMAQSGDIRYVC